MKNSIVFVLFLCFVAGVIMWWVTHDLKKVNDPYEYHIGLSKEGEGYEVYTREGELLGTIWYEETGKLDSIITEHRNNLK